MLRTARFLLVRGAIAWLVIAGFFGGVQGARNLFHFLAWLLALGFYLELMERRKAGVTRHARLMPIWVTATFDILVIGALVWTGAFMAAIPWLLLTIFFHAGVAREQKEAAAA